jgi:hypothetical protein
MQPIHIDDDENLYRRIRKRNRYADGTIKSNAFKRNAEHPDPQPSVDVASLTTEDECISRAPELGWGLAVITARDVRSVPPLDVMHDPIEGDLEAGIPANPAHAYIHDIPDEPNGLALCDQLAQKARLLREPTKE